MTSSVISQAEVLFAVSPPIHDKHGPYSLQWAGHAPGESILDLVDYLATSKDLHEFKSQIHKVQKWKSVPMNVVMADNSGNIGYALMSSTPMRKNEYPYLGCRVLDGTTSKHDWIDITDMKNLPFVLNPKKGYFLTANNRIVPENSKFDAGGAMVSTGRSRRIEEMI